MEYRFSEGQLSPPADPATISAFSESNNGQLPPDYLAFIQRHDGGSGFLGPYYFTFWKVSELGQFNLEYEVQKYAPGIILFGSDGGGEGFGFNTNDPAIPVVVIPLVGLALESAIKVADRFSDLFSPDFKLNFV